MTLTITFNCQETVAWKQKAFSWGPQLEDFLWNAGAGVYQLLIVDDIFLLFPNWHEDQVCCISTGLISIDNAQLDPDPDWTMLSIILIMIKYIMFEDQLYCSEFHVWQKSTTYKFYYGYFVWIQSDLILIKNVLQFQ